MAKTLTIHDFFKRFPDDAACLAHLFTLRYGNDYGCPKCGVCGAFRKLAKHPAYTCNCGHHVHPMQGTIFQDSHTPLTKWFYALYLFTTTRHGVPAKEMQRQLGVSYPTALRMTHLIRQHMAKADGDPMLGGHVEVDETYVGGHKKGGRGGRDAKEKVAVFGMVERGGDVMLRVIEHVDSKTLGGHIRRNVEKGSVISSDEWPSYKVLTKAGFEHGVVNHGREQWVDGKHHTNTIEGFWSHLKRSIRGTHVSVSRKHLPKYLGEFEFRYNLRHSPSAMLGRLLATF
jgi:transposase-like protein